MLVVHLTMSWVFSATKNEGRTLLSLAQSCQPSCQGQERVKWTPTAINASGRDSRLVWPWWKPNSNLWSIMRERKRNSIPKIHDHTELIKSWFFRAAFSPKAQVGDSTPWMEKKNPNNLTSALFCFSSYSLCSFSMPTSLIFRSETSAIRSNFWVSSDVRLSSSWRQSRIFPQLFMWALTGCHVLCWQAHVQPSVGASVCFPQVLQLF